MPLALALTSLGLAACDRFDPPAPAPPPAAARAADHARVAAREALTAALMAAQAVTASCVAAELHWEADADGNTVARHYSRPCLPERCAPGPTEIEALRTRARAARALVEGEPSLRVPSYQGLVALTEAMVGFADTALAGASALPEKERALRLGGLSMHYTALAAAFHELYPDAVVLPEPPSLTASLTVAEPGGDPCKGWALPQYCDVRGVKVPKDRKWRSDPPCIEVEGIRK